MSKFIKVTPNGENKSRIVLATLKSFYLSLGAKVEIPTDEEVYEAEPSERPAGVAPKLPTEVEQNIKKLVAERDAIWKDRDEFKKALEAKEAIIAEQAAQLDKLREELAATETSLAESEKVIEQLRNAATKAEKPAKEAKEAK